MAEPPCVEPSLPPSSGSVLNISMGMGGDACSRLGTKMEGYDYEFVPVPDSCYECAICLLVLREPRQTPCGHRFCKDCILKWLRESQTRCPVDNKDISEEDLFPDNFAKREIQNFNVRCPNSKEGCDVITSVIQLPAHQNKCPFALVPCPNKCAKVLLRRDLENHVKTACDQRNVQCPNCLRNFFAVELEVHVQTCPQGPILCQYCEKEVMRMKVKIHEDEECPKRVVACCFHLLGCDTQAERCAMDSHLRDNMTGHIMMLCRGVTSILHHLHLNPLAVSGNPSPLSQRAMSPTEMSGIMSGMVPAIQQLVATSGAFQPDRRHQDNALLSLPPVTHSHKSPLSSSSLDSATLRPPGPAVAGLQRSPSDPKYMSAGTQEASSVHYMSDPCSDDSEGGNLHPGSLPSSRRQDSSTVSTYLEEQKLVLHEQSLLELRAKMDFWEKNYRQKVKIHEQQISEMEGRICNGQYFWKIRNYSHYQLEAERGETTALHSQPFYTSPSGGYKLCVRANLNGVDSARGSHLSLFIHFMQGDYDDVLDWPFSGRIILSVMDQNECCEIRHHVAETLTSKPNLAAFQRPVTPRNHKGFGYMEFLPLSVLKNSSYVKNDTLIIKAHVLSNS